MSPTLTHYLISFVAGLLLAVLGIATDQFAQHPDGNIDWRLFGFAVLGGAVLFARDWMRNNMGAFLENITPAQVQSAVAQQGSSVLVPPTTPKPFDTMQNPPAA